MNLFFKRYQFPILSLFLCILAYGLLIPWLGLYWDDWALTWFSHEYSANYFIDYAAYRPVSGWLYTLFFSLLGENILAWQIFALVANWLSVLSFWWLLRLIWPRGGRAIEVAALLFALYPGFSQYPISVTYSLYWLYYVMLLISLGLMLKAWQSSGRARTLSTAAALLISAALMLSSEYFYGLELLRPLLLWITYRQLAEKPATRAKVVATAWAPYLLLVVVLFAWRYLQSQGLNALYEPSLVFKLIEQPLVAIPALVATIAGDIAEASLLAWGRLGDMFAHPNLASVAWLAGAALVVLATVVAGWLLWPKRKEDREEAGWTKAALGIGIAALLVSGLSFWIAELPMRLSFPLDRFTLPMKFGVALALAALWQSIPWPKAKVILIATVLGLSVGYHFYNGNLYRQEWEQQQGFFDQLRWRIPGLQPATALLTVELPMEHYTDNSLTAPLNWMYASGATQPDLPYYLAYLDLRADPELFGLGGDVIRKTYADGVFVGNSENVLLIYYDPPACLRVLDPRIDQNYPQLPELLAGQLGRSNLERIIPEGESRALPFWGSSEVPSWCYYYETADLARQMKDWEQVVDLGDFAFALEDAANHPAEYVVFILGYAITGDIDEAMKLTAQALRINPRMQPMLCGAWAQIDQETSLDSDSHARVETLLNCT